MLTRWASRCAGPAPRATTAWPIPRTSCPLPVLLVRDYLILCPYFNICSGEIACYACTCTRYSLVSLNDHNTHLQCCLVFQVITVRMERPLTLRTGALQDPITPPPKALSPRTAWSVPRGSTVLAMLTRRTLVTVVLGGTAQVGRTVPTPPPTVVSVVQDTTVPKVSLSKSTCSCI